MRIQLGTQAGAPTVDYEVSEALAGLYLISAFVGIDAGAFGEVPFLTVINKSGQIVVQAALQTDIAIGDSRDITFSGVGASYENGSLNQAVVPLGPVRLDEGDRIQLWLSQPSTSSVSQPMIIVVE